MTKTMGLFRRRAPSQFWLSCDVHGDDAFLRHHAIRLLDSGRPTEVIAIGCELWRRGGISNNQAADLIRDGYYEWIPRPTDTSAQAVEFLEWAFTRAQNVRSAPPGRLDQLPYDVVKPISDQQTMAAWTGFKLAEAVEHLYGGVTSAETNRRVCAVLARLHPQLMPPAALDFAQRNCGPR